jgi:predicted nucleic acid-binding Zn ribbon protein
MWKSCKACGKELKFPKRYDSEYCNSTCRKRAERKRKANSAQNLYNQSFTLISKFSKVNRDEQKAAIEMLRTLRKEIDAQLQLLGDAETQAYFDMLQAVRRKRENLG